MKTNKTPCSCTELAERLDVAEAEARLAQVPGFDYDGSLEEPLNATRLAFWAAIPRLRKSVNRLRERNNNLLEQCNLLKIERYNRNGEVAASLVNRGMAFQEVCEILGFEYRPERLKGRKSFRSNIDLKNSRARKESGI